MGDVEPEKKKGQALTIEKIYQKKSQLEHILLRPDTYIGKFYIILYLLDVVHVVVVDDKVFCFIHVVK